jgi:chromosome segregation ATPase
MSNDTQLTSLSTLAVEIDALNEQANIYANQAVIYAAKSGQKLLLAKAQCNHGQFKSWLDENCKIPYETSRKYMRLAKERPELLNSNWALNPILPSVTQMIELLSADEKVNEVVTAKIEAGEDVTIKEIQRLKKEAADLQVQNESLQNDLMSKVQRLDESEAKVRFQKITVDAIEKQNDELRNRDQQLIDAKVGEERAKLILENQDAIAQAKREAENAKGELERMKKDQEKSIKDGVLRELHSLQSDIDQKRYQLEQHEKDIESLKKTKSELDAEVGALAIHKESIKAIKENLSFITAHFDEAFYTREIPTEVLSDWQSIHYAVSQIKKQLGSWFDQKSAIESSVTIDDLVDIGTILENVEEAFV